MITSPSSDSYESVTQTLKRTITDSSDLKVKTEAIRAFAIGSFYGDLSDDEILSNLSFLLEIIASDGQYIDAQDEPEPVSAALEAYGFLTTLIDDFASPSAEALEAFTDQLDSSSASVLIAAGENIALLYEKAYAPLEEDESMEDFPEDSHLSIPDPNGGKNISHYIRRYPLAPSQSSLETRLSSLQSHSSKALSREDRRALHSSFADILYSVQHPTRGPRFSTTVDPETGREAGSSFKLRVATSTSNGDKSGGAKLGGKGMAAATIDKWWLLHRHRALKEALGNGFMAHYEVNEAIFEALPIVFVTVGRTGKKGRRDKAGRQWLEVES